MINLILSRKIIDILDIFKSPKKLEVSEMTGSKVNFPKTVYVTIAGRKGDEFLETATNVKYIDEFAEQVAVYELKEIKTLKVTRELK